MAKLKHHLKKQSVPIAVVLTALIVGGAVYGWQYSQRRSLQRSNTALHAQLDQAANRRQPNVRDKDAILRMIRADYLADPAHKIAPRIKIDKQEGPFALSTVTEASESYRVVTKKVADQWVIIIKSKSPPDYELKRFQVPAKLFES